MNYFILSQDSRMNNIVEPMGISRIIKKEMLRQERLEELKELDLQFPILDINQSDFTDFIERPISIISDSFKKLIEMYDPSIHWVPIILLDQQRKSQVLYWLLVPPCIQCLSENTEFHRDNSVKNLIINEELAAPYPIFKINNILEDYTVINIELAESLLRREFSGISLKKIQTEGKWDVAQQRQVRKKEDSMI